MLSVRKNVNLLIVDDQPYNLFILEEVLKDHQKIAMLEKAMNGIEAIEQIQKLQEQNKKFDLLLIDLNMPIMDGKEMMQTL